MKIAKDEYDIDLNSCILWQYDKAYSIHRLLQNEYDFYDFCTNYFWNQYFANIFNIATANRNGLAIWANIVGVKTFYVAKEPAAGEKPIYNDFTDEFLRKLIIARFYLLDSNGSCEEINNYLKMIFGTRKDGSYKVICTDVQYKGAYNAVNLYEGNADHSQYKGTRPMEIYYNVNVGDKELDKATALDAEMSEEEWAISTIHANKKTFFPHPAGVMINGEDAEIEIEEFGEDAFFGFEFEDTLDRSEDFFGVDEKTGEYIWLRPMGWARFVDEKDA